MFFKLIEKKTINEIRLTFKQIEEKQHINKICKIT